MCGPTASAAKMTSAKTIPFTRCAARWRPSLVTSQR
jgi:hypothetical protein